MTDEPALDRERERWARRLVAAGIGALVVRFALDFPLWPDEAFVALNVARRGLAGVLGPLDHYQIAPPAWLALVEVLEQALGFRPRVLRLPSFATAIAAILVFHRTCRRELPAAAAAAATGFLAVSYWVTRHGAEVKPYALDLLVAVLVIDLALRCGGRRGGRMPAAAFAALGGLAFVAFAWSFPSVFVAGGAVLFLLVDAARSGGPQRWPRAAGALAIGVLLVSGFGLVYALHASRSGPGDVAWLQAYWARSFPPLEAPWRIPGWLLGMLTGELLAHPVGGRDGGGTATFLLVLLGLGAAWRGGLVRDGDPGASRRRLVLLLAPFVLALAAAALERYPFGAPTRTQLHLAPAACLLAGVGLAALLEGLARRFDDTTAGRRRGLVISSCVLIAVPVVGALRDVASPAKNPTDALLRDLARAIHGGGEAAGGRVLSLREDLGVTFSPGLDREQSLLQAWLCNVHAVRAAPVGAGSPGVGPGDGAVLVTNYRVDGRARPGARADWIAAFAAERDLVLAGTVLVPVPDLDKRGRPKRRDELEVLRFVPRDGTAAPESAAGDDRR